MMRVRFEGAVATRAEQIRGCASLVKDPKQHEDVCDIRQEYFDRYI